LSEHRVGLGISFARNQLCVEGKATVAAALTLNCRV